MGNTVKMYTLRRRGHCIFSIFFGYIKERPWYLLYNNVYDPYIAIRDEDLRYIAAASPDVVLALVAEFHHLKLSRNLQWLEHLRLKKETSQRYLEMLDAAKFEARVAVKLAINTTRNSQPCPYGNSRTCTCECDLKHRSCIDNRLKLARLAVEQEMEEI